MKWLLLATFANVAAEWPNLTPEQRDWFPSLRNSHGLYCCSTADGHHVEWDIKDGHYWAIVEGKWRQVPDDAVIHDPNKVGAAVIWLTSARDQNNERGIRCFIPGSGA